MLDNSADRSTGQFHHATHQQQFGGAPADVASSPGRMITWCGFES